jgi:hypothetical protein
LGNKLVPWSCKQQQTVARSSTESEYKALANAAVELSTESEYKALTNAAANGLNQYLMILVFQLCILPFYGATT